MISLGRLAREVVAQRIVITGALTAALSVAVNYGWITPDWSNMATTWTTRGLDLVGIAVAVFWVRSGVTPAHPALNPTSHNGTPLVEAPDAPPPQ